MTFEKIEKRINFDTCRIPDNQISIGKTSFGFGKNATAHFEGFDFLEIWIDKENKLVAFNPTNDNKVGYKIRKLNSGGVQLGVKTIENYKIPKGRYEFKLEESGMIVVKYDL